MYNFIKGSGFSFFQGSRSFRQVFRIAFCCHRPDPLMSPTHGLSYATFGKANEKTQAYYDEREPLTPTSDVPSCSRSEITPSNSSRDDDLSNDLLKAELKKTPPTVKHVDGEEDLLLRGCPNTISISSELSTETSLSVQQFRPSTSAPAGFDILVQEIEKQPLIQLDTDYIDGKNITKDISLDSGICNQEILSPENKLKEDGSREDPEGCSDISASNSLELKENFKQIDKSNIVIPEIASDEVLLQVMDKCDSPLEVLSALTYFSGEMTPELSVACIHHVYAKTSMLHPRNSKMYNQMCGVILTDKEFRKLILIIEMNVTRLTNFALLTAASDLLWLRLTLKKPTIPALLSQVDVENLTLEELRLLSSCLHTPNIPLVNSEYFYNVSAAVAMQEIPNINDLYTLLNIMKCFGRYFTNVAKRQCENKVNIFASDLWGEWPDGRPKAAHMFDAFYRMGYAPSRDLLQKASNVIVNGDIPVQPQDISAILRYCVKYGYGFQDKELLDKLSGVMYNRLMDEHASQFTTNIKWLTVFYYYNTDLFDRFINCVKRDMQDLDFVALSDALDTLAQIYYTPKEADDFFDKLHHEMLNKLPTLNTSHVHNAKRKLLLTAFHFAVYGRYPEEIIKLALVDNQIPGHMSHSGTRHFLVDLCRAISIERPDLLPKNLPMHLLQNHGRPKLYAFEKDVQDALDYAVGGPQFYHLMSSPACNFPFFLLRARLDGTILPAHDGFIPPHRHQVVQNVAIVPLPRSRFCMDSQHAVGKTRLVLRLLRAQGARVVTVPHFNWDQKPADYKLSLLKNKIFQQRADDIVK